MDTNVAKIKLTNEELKTVVGGNLQTSDTRKDTEKDANNQSNSKMPNVHNFKMIL